MINVLEFSIKLDILLKLLKMILKVTKFLNSNHFIHEMKLKTITTKMLKQLSSD